MAYSFKDGRIWFQRNKFSSYGLLLPYGMTGVTDPTGALTAVREPSPVKRRKTIITDILRGEPGLPEFQIETRLFKTLNYMFALKDCAVNFQVHMGACDRPDNYYSSEVLLHWERAYRGDMSLDRLAIIEGDDAPVAETVPWSSEIGPILLDMKVEFLSARTVTETEAFTDAAFLESECLEDCSAQEDAGENGYAVTDVLAGSPVNVANVWYTEDKGESWAETSERPFAGGEKISSVVISGTKKDHRIVVARGTTDGANPAEIAYADVTSIGTTSWVNVDVGSVNGQYINDLLWIDWTHLYAVTDDGYVYLSTDGGATWEAKLTTAVNELWAIDGIGYGDNAGVIYVAGDSNTIYKSEDYGSLWSAITGPSAGAGDNIRSLTLTPDGTLFLGNDAGELYGSYDGGDEWTTLGVQGITPTSVTSLASWGDSQIWLTATISGGAGRVLRSLDGGASFRLWSLNIPTNSGLNFVVPFGPNEVFIGGAPQGGTGFITRTKSQVTGDVLQSYD